MPTPSSFCVCACSVMAILAKSQLISSALWLSNLYKFNTPLSSPQHSKTQPCTCNYITMFSLWCKIYFCKALCFSWTCPGRSHCNIWTHIALTVKHVKVVYIHICMLPIVPMSFLCRLNRNIQTAHDRSCRCASTCRDHSHAVSVM